MNLENICHVVLERIALVNCSVELKERKEPCLESRKTVILIAYDSRDFQTRHLQTRTDVDVNVDELFIHHERRRASRTRTTRSPFIIVPSEIAHRERKT